MSNSKYTQPNQIQENKEVSAESIKKLKIRHSKAFWYSVTQYIPHLKTGAFTLLIVVLLVVAVNRLNYLFFKTSYFEIKEIEVIGNNYFTEEHIIKTAGIAPGMNIFSIKREDIISKLTKEPRIKSVNVDLDGLYKIKLRIQERNPKVYAKVGLAFYEISDDSVIINTEGMGEKELPIITGLDLKNAALGDSLAKNDNYFLAQKWLNELDSDIVKNLSEINFASAQNPYLILFSGEKIFPKNLEDFQNKYDFLLTLLDNLRKNNVEPFYLDMRGEHFVVRPKKVIGS